MKLTVDMPREIEAKWLIIDIEIRYVGDSDDDDVPTTTPLLNGKQWKAKVDIDTGLIDCWPQGVACNMFAKVCDAGIYTVLSPSDEQLAQVAGYVPNGVVPGEYGDYVDLKIDEAGRITNWPKSPDLSELFEIDEG